MIYIIYIYESNNLSALRVPLPHLHRTLLPSCLMGPSCLLPWMLLLPISLFARLCWHA